MSTVSVTAADPPTHGPEKSCFAGNLDNGAIATSAGVERITVEHADRAAKHFALKERWDHYDIELRQERFRQNEKFTGSATGTQRHHLFSWGEILSEEIGEAARARVEAVYGSDKSLAALRLELIQSAAVIWAILERIDANDPALFAPDGTYAHDK